jgi:hypothetical protein
MKLWPGVLIRAPSSPEYPLGDPRAALERSWLASEWLGASLPFAFQPVSSSADPRSPLVGSANYPGDLDHPFSTGLVAGNLSHHPSHER